MGSSQSVLIVDDDADLRGALAEQLRDAGFATLEAETAGEAFRLAGYAPDLMLLDLNLPDTDGRLACRQLRDQGFQAPIIMLTAAAGDQELIESLAAGADDYVVKPFTSAVLLARIRAKLRAYEHSDAVVIHIGDLQFRPADKLIITAGRRKIGLTAKETSILRYLHQAGDRAVGREELLGEVWGYNPRVTSHTLETHIYRLRRKLERDPARPTMVVTAAAGGYQLLSPSTGAWRAEEG